MRMRQVSLHFRMEFKQNMFINDGQMVLQELGDAMTS